MTRASQICQSPILHLLQPTIAKGLDSWWFLLEDCTSAISSLSAVLKMYTSVTNFHFVAVKKFLFCDFFDLFSLQLQKFALAILYCWTQEYILTLSHMAIDDIHNIYFDSLFSDIVCRQQWKLCCVQCWQGLCLHICLGLKCTHFWLHMV